MVLATTDVCFLASAIFSGLIHPVGKEEDIQYELQESQNVQIPKPAPLMGTLPLTLLNPALWKPYQLSELNTYEKRRTFLQPILDRALRINCKVSVKS